MSNSRFSVQVHIISLLAITNEVVTSDYIAGSVGCHPVVVRKELAKLKKKGLICSQEGKNGGVKLLKKPSEIHLDELFITTFEEADVFSINKNEPNPNCTIGKNINSIMRKINTDAENALLCKLHETTIESIVSKL